MKKKEQKKVGRPGKFDPTFCKKATKLCLLGATDKDLADFFEVTESTINNWKVDYPEFLESIKKGKTEADAQVANRLFKRALGYKHPDTDIRVCDGMIVQTPLIKHYPPDPTAAIFWLKNRQPEKWRDKQELQIGQTGDQVFKIGGIEVKF
jgi:hypothetical protein